MSSAIFEPHFCPSAGKVTTGRSTAVLTKPPVFHRADHGNTGTVPGATASCSRATAAAQERTEMCCTPIRRVVAWPKSHQVNVMEFFLDPSLGQNEKLTSSYLFIFGESLV